MRGVFWLLAIAACSGSPDDPPPPGDAEQPPPASCADRSPQPLDATWTLAAGGLMREAKIHVPASYNPQQRTPVVIDIHGRTMTATQEASVTHMLAKSDAAGFIAVHPESATSPTSWNAGGGCCDPAYSQNIDDIGFIAALIDELDAKLCIDTARVYATGLSNGGYLSYRLACELSDRIAAIAPVAGVLAVSPCEPARAMPVFAVHGSSDPLVSYTVDAQSIDFWASFDQCTTTDTTYQNGDASCVTHGACRSGAEVVFCTIADGGHQWPGGEALPLLGKKSDDLIATDALWTFFQAHPRP